MSYLKNDSIPVEVEASLKTMVLDDIIYKHLISWLSFREAGYSENFISLSGKAVFNDEYRLPAVKVKGKLEAISEIIFDLEKLRRK